MRIIIIQLLHNDVIRCKKIIFHGSEINAMTSRSSLSTSFDPLTLFSNQYHSYCIVITFVARESILYKCNNSSNNIINNWGEDFSAYKLGVPQDPKKKNVVHYHNKLVNICLVKNWLKGWIVVCIIKSYEIRYSTTWDWATLIKYCNRILSIIII